MSEQEDKTPKPFYDNIVSSRKRTHQHDPKKKTDDDAVRSHRKVTQPSQPTHAPRASRAGSEERFSGNDRSKGSETRVPRAARTSPRDEHVPPSDDSTGMAPRALRHDHSTKDGTRAPRTPRAPR